MDAHEIWQQASRFKKHIELSSHLSPALTQLWHTVTYRHMVKILLKPCQQYHKCSVHLWVSHNIKDSQFLNIMGGKWIMKVAIKRKKPGTIHWHQWCFVPQTTHIVKNIGTNAGPKKEKFFVWTAALMQQQKWDRNKLQATKIHDAWWVCWIHRWWVWLDLWLLLKLLHFLDNRETHTVFLYEVISQSAVGALEVVVD